MTTNEAKSRTSEEFSISLQYNYAGYKIMLTKYNNSCLLFLSLCRCASTEETPLKRRVFIVQLARRRELNLIKS
jgi:hypothetical protein